MRPRQRDQCRLEILRPLAVRGVAALEQDIQLPGRRQVQLGTDPAYALDHALQPGDMVLGFGIRLAGRGKRREHDGFAFETQQRVDALPDFLGDERHDRVQGPERGLEHVQQRVARGGADGLVFRLERGLGQFEVPVAVLAPGKFIKCLRSEVQAVVGHLVFHLGYHAVHARQDPAIDRARVRCGPDGSVFCLHQNETGGVPQLVAEIAVAFDAAEIETDVAPGRGECGKGKAQGVGAEGRDAVRELLAGRLFNGRCHLRLHQARGAFLDQGFQLDAVDQVDRVEHVALGLRHLLAVRVADQAVDVHFSERHVVHELEAHHDHAGNPEKDDVETRDQHAGRVVALQFGCLFGPAQGRERPQRGGEPGVQHVLVLVQRHRGVEACFAAGVVLVLADVNSALVVVPGRNAMTPPELAADAPVFDAVHPVEIGLAPVRRHELDAPVLDRLDGRPGQRLDFHVPLVGQVGLDHRVRPVAARNHQLVVLDFFEQAQFLHVLDNLLTGLESIHAAVGFRRAVVDAGVVVENVDDFQVVALADLVVVEIVRRRDLDAAGTEFRVHVVVGNDGYAAAGQRQLDFEPDQFGVALVLRVHRERAVSQHRFGARGGDHHVALAVGPRVAEMPHAALFFRRHDFQVGQGRVQHGVPVDQPFSPVDQTFLVQRDELAPHGLRQPFVHREAVTRPVHRGAEAAHLHADAVAGVFFPFPHRVDEPFAAEIVPRGALGEQLAFDHHLRRDTGVVGAGLPQRVGALHALPARQRIHDRVLEGVPHVQAAGDVRRRQHDAVGFALTRRLEPSFFFPGPVNARLDCVGVVALVHFAHVIWWVSGLSPRSR